MFALTVWQAYRLEFGSRLVAHMRALLASLLLFVCSFAHAALKLACYQDRWSYATTCIDESAVTSNGDTRAAPLYSGGANASQKMPYVLVTNCAERISTLRGYDGAAVKADISSLATAIRVIAQWMCEVKNPSIDPNLIPLARSSGRR